MSQVEGINLKTREREQDNQLQGNACMCAGLYRLIQEQWNKSKLESAQIVCAGVGVKISRHFSLNGTNNVFL